MNTINVGGKSIHVKGDNISIINGKIFIDGKLHTDVNKEKGYIQNVIIKGPVHSVTSDTSIDCGDVSGSVTAKNITCGNINGNVDGKNITCGRVSGSVTGKNINQ